MKKLISIVLMFTLMAALTGCGSSTQAQTTDTQAVAEAQEETAETPEAEDPETEPAETEQQTDEAAVSETEAEPEVKDPVPAEHSDVLVAYFSATGTTKGVAGSDCICFFGTECRTICSSGSRSHSSTMRKPGGWYFLKTC